MEDVVHDLVCTILSVINASRFAIMQQLKCQFGVVSLGPNCNVINQNTLYSK